MAPLREALAFANECAARSCRALDGRSGIPTAEGAGCMTHRVAVIAGDGVGPEVVAEARRRSTRSDSASRGKSRRGARTTAATGRDDAGGRAEVVRRHDAVLLGAVGDPAVPDHVTLWGLLLPIRQGLDLWANVRPARLLEGVPSRWPAAGGRHALRAREHRGRVLRHRRARPPGA